MNKFSSQTALVAEGSDTLSAEFEKNQTAEANHQYTNSSRTTKGRHSPGQDIHMTNLNNIQINAGMFYMMKKILFLIFIIKL